MSVTIVNYSRLRGDLGKFVLLVRRSVDNQGILLISDLLLDPQHRDIIARWERTEGQSPNAGGYTVRGGGWWKYSGTGALRFFGRSAAYGRYDAEWLRNRLEAGRIFTEDRIVFE